MVSLSAAIVMEGASLCASLMSIDAVETASIAMPSAKGRIVLAVLLFILSAARAQTRGDSIPLASAERASAASSAIR